jgi:hypothetical protein
MAGGVLPAALLGIFVSPTIWLVVTTTALGLLGGAVLSGARWSWDIWGGSAAAAMLVADAAAVLGWRDLLVILLLVVTSKPFIRALRARIGARPTDSRQDRVSSPRSTYVGACLGSMSGRELCQAWSASFVQVKSADPHDRRLQAGVRRSLLDELERRDADRFRAWLARSPSAASDPLWVVSLPKGTSGSRGGRSRRRGSGRARRIAP